MGDKNPGRLAAEEVGVSGVPGTTEIIQDPDEVRSFGEEHGYRSLLRPPMVVADVA